MKHRRRIKIVERKLGRSRVWGFAYGDGIVEIDPRQRPQRYLDTLCHELLHLAFQNASETKILKATRIVRRGLWDQNYRKVAQ